MLPPPPPPVNGLPAGPQARCLGETARSESFFREVSGWQPQVRRTWGWLDANDPTIKSATRTQPTGWVPGYGSAFAETSQPMLSSRNVSRPPILYPQMNADSRRLKAQFPLLIFDFFLVARSLPYYPCLRRLLAKETRMLEVAMADDLDKSPGISGVSLRISMCRQHSL